MAACASDACEPLTPVVLDGRPVVSKDRPSVTLRKRADGGADLILFLRGPMPGPDGSPDTSHDWYRVLRLERGARTWSTVVAVGPFEPGPSLASAVAYTNQEDADPANDRLVLASEPGGRPIITSSRPGTPDFGAEWLEYLVNQWGNVRAFDRQRFPGALPTFFQGNPAGIDADKVGRVRMVEALVGDGRAVLRFHASGAGESDAPEYEYDEQRTLEWGVCAALSSPGVDLVRADVPLRCPAAEPRGVFRNRLAGPLRALNCVGGGCPPPPVCLPCWLDPFVNPILGDPWWLAVAPPPVAAFPKTVELTSTTSCLESR
jgi:hypothetical protein